jgi:streptogramin lyase
VTSAPGSFAPAATAPPSFAPRADTAVTLASDGSFLGGQSVGNDPGDVTVGGGAVWVANLGSSTVSRIDPGGGGQATIGGIGRPSSLAYEAAADRLWVLDGLGAKVSIVDARNGKVLDSFRQTGRGIAVGRGLVWVADEIDDAVIVTDPLSRAVVATVRLPAGTAPVAVAVGTDVVWVGAKGSSSVFRIDPATRAVKGGAIAIAGRPTAISIGDAVWVGSGPDDALIRLDPTDGRVAQTYPAICDEPGGLAAVGSSVWLTCRRDGTVLQVGTAGVNVTAKVGLVPNDVAADGDKLWVTLAAE